MTRLKSELEVICPCCQSTLVIDANLGRVVSHSEPERGNKPELNDAQRILAEEAARREAMFQQSVNAEKTRGDALSRRFEEALKQAKQEPITRPDEGLRPGLNIYNLRFGDRRLRMIVRLYRIDRRIADRRSSITETPAVAPSIVPVRGSPLVSCRRLRP